jgi:flagellar biosynthesis protein FlhF
MAAPQLDPGLQANGPIRVLAFARAAQSLRGVLASALKRHRLPDLLVESLIRDAQFWPAETPQSALARALAGRMRVAPIDFQKARGVLLVGPTGAGKSAVAAKIAHQALLLGREVELVRAVDGMALLRTATFDGGSLMVMEASGFNPVNRRALNAFAALSEGNDMGSPGGVESIGVVSAASDAQDVCEIVTGLRAPRVIVTGLDRTTRLGATLAAVTGAALAHVTHGPRAADGLETLNPADLAGRLLN